MRGSKLLVAPVVAALLLGACGSDDDNGSSGSTTEGQAGTALAVYTVPQLEDIVQEVVQAYEAENPEASVEITTEGQAAIAASVGDKKPDVAILPALVLDPISEGLEPASFGRTLAVIAVPADNPGDVADLTAFAADTDLRTQICGEDTEIGNFSLIVLSRAGVNPDPDTVAAGCEAEALQQVAAEELDAALMFRGGVEVPDGVAIVDINEEANLIIDLSYVVIDDSAGATGFGEFLASDAAREILTAKGYLP